jgi:hypothetical protein
MRPRQARSTLIQCLLFKPKLVESVPNPYSLTPPYGTANFVLPPEYFLRYLALSHFAQYIMSTIRLYLKSRKIRISDTRRAVRNQSGGRLISKTAIWHTPHLAGASFPRSLLACPILPSSGASPSPSPSWVVNAPPSVTFHFSSILIASARIIEGRKHIALCTAVQEKQADALQAGCWCSMGRSVDPNSVKKIL